MPLPPEEVLRELDKVLSDPSFASSKRLGGFLRFVVQHSVSGDGSVIKEYRIGAEVYERGADFDPRVDSIVRVEATRLRNKLADYYEGPGAHDAVRIEIPKGTYTPVFRSSQGVPPASPIQSVFWLRKPAAKLLIGGVGLIVVAVYLSGLRRSPVSAYSRSDGPPSVAVLPFADLSPSHDREYLSDGIAAELINRLSRLPNVRVAARASAFQFKGKAHDVRAIGHQLDVATILEGTILQDREQLRVEVELISVKDGYLLWSARYERRIADVFSIEDEVAGRITDSLGVNLSNTADRLVSGTWPPAPEAYELYLRGRQAWEARGVEDLRRSIAYYEQAIAQDQSFALAWAGLADTYTVMIANDNVPALEYAPKAREAALKAIGLDPSLAEPHAALGLILPVFDWNWNAAEREFQRAIALRPGYATAHQWYGLQLMGRGRFDEAERELRTALALDPLSRMIRYSMGDVYFYSHRYAQAIAQYQRVLDMDPAWWTAHQKIGLAYDLEGQLDKAAAELRVALDRMPGAAEPYMNLELIFRKQGRTAEADQIKRTYQSRFEGQPVPLRDEAIYHAERGEVDAAIKSLQQIYERHEAVQPTFKVDPWLDGIRSDPRFVAILRKANLGQ